MEIRSYTELGAPKVGDGRIIEGYAVVFGQESRVLYDREKQRAFVEVIEKGAITEELLRSCDVKALLDHNGDFAVEMIKRGDIFGSSFAYALNEKDKTKVSYSMKDGLLLRTVHMIDRISDISPVVDPAFYGTDVTVRSMDDTIAELSGENKDYLNEINNLRKSI